LEHGGKVFGLLSVSIPAGPANEKEELSIFEEIAGDISYALYSLEMEEARKRAEKALRESEERYRNFLETLPDMVYTLRIFRPDITLEEKEKILNCIDEIKSANEDDVDGVITGVSDQLLPFIDGTILYSNKMASAILGYSLDRLGDINMAEIVAPEYLETALNFILTLFVQDSRHNLEYELMTANGDRIIVNVSANLIGEFPFYSQGVVRDITGHKQMEKTLKESETRFRAVVESAPDAIVSIDARGNVIFWNHAAEKIFGYSADEIIGKPVTRVIPERFREPYQKAMNRVISTGKTTIIGRPLELDGLKKDGSEFPLGLSIASWESGGQTFFTGLIHDITKRKQAERALRESEERYRTIVDTINEGFMVIDSKKILTYCNDWMAHLLGYPRDELLNRPVESFLDPLSAQNFLERFEKRGTAGGGQLELTWRKKNGGLVLSLTSYKSVIDDKELFHEWLAAVTDVTRLKTMEARLGQAQKLEAVGVLAAGIAHEINTPTQYIYSNLEFIAQGTRHLAELAGMSQQLVEAANSDKGVKEKIGEIENLLKDRDISYFIEEIPGALSGCVDGLSRVSKIVESMRYFSHPGEKKKSIMDINQALENAITISKKAGSFPARVSRFRGRVKPVAAEYNCQRQPGHR